MTGYTELNTFRYERKFVADGHSRASAEAAVKQNSAFFVSIFHPRSVNNIYFDTPGLDCFFDNLFGNGERWKARIRWYNNRFGTIENPILEFKIKKGLTGTKKSFQLPSFTLDEKQFHFPHLKEIIQHAELPEDIKGRMAGMQPVLFNSYRRSYFATLNKRFRITVDTDLEYFAVRPSWNHMQHRYREPEKAVIELKYDTEHDLEAAKITNQLPFRLNKNSKFVAGMSHFKNVIAE